MTDGPVYITAEVTREADRFHTDPECRTVAYSDLTQIQRSTAQRHGLDECQFCAGVASLQGANRRLAELDPDDVLGGESA